LAGTAATVAGSQEQKRDRKRILNRNLADADMTQDKASTAVLQEADTLAPAARNKAMAAAEEAAFARSMSDAAPAPGASLVDTAQGGGAVSSDFTRAKSEREGMEAGRLSDVTRELSRVRAPGEVAVEQSSRRSALAEQLGSMWSSQRGRSQAAQMDAEAVDMPGYGQIGQLVALAAGAYGGAAGAGAAAGGGDAVGAYLATGGAEGSILGAGTGGGAGAVGAATQPKWMAALQGLNRAPKVQQGLYTGRRY